MNITYSKATTSNTQTVTELMMMLYEDNTFVSLYEENEALLLDSGQAVFLASDGEKTVGFAHCALRNDYVEGTQGGPVGYLEGIYVVPDYRLHDIARTFLSLCEGWAKEKGCKEFASDCEHENIDSCKFHLKTGFQEANRIVCFTKKL